MTSTYQPTPFKRVDWSKMVGTEKTDTYVKCAQGPWGMVGFREYQPGEFRIRVEPTAAGAAVLQPFFTSERRWKQPAISAALTGRKELELMIGLKARGKQPVQSHQNRFSTTVTGQPELERVVRLAIYAMAAGGNQPVLKRDCPVWVKRFLRRDTLEAFVRGSKLPGYGLAASWSTTVLYAKAAQVARAKLNRAAE